jgi:hypothetical protein
MPGTPPMPPLPPLEPGKPGTTRIIINGKEVSPTELDKLDPTIIKTIDIKGDEKGAQKVIMLKMDSLYADRNVRVAVPIQGNSSVTQVMFDTTDRDGKQTYTFVQKTTEKSELPKDVLYIIDGKEMQSGSIKDIDPGSIKKVSVLQGEAAVKIYGEKAKNGVIEITTKK